MSDGELMESRARAREGWVSLGPFSIHYLEMGDGEPLIYLHAAVAGWDRLKSRLALHRRVIAPELPGFGSTPPLPPDVHMGLPELALLIRDFITTCAEPPIDIVARSWGAKVALWLVHQQPSIAGRLVLEAPALALEPSKRRQLVGLNEDGRQQVTPLLDRYKQASPPDQELITHLPSIPCPVLVLLGESDQRYQPQTMLPVYDSHLRHARTQMIPGAGHLLHLDQQDLILGYLETFLGQRM